VGGFTINGAVAEVKWGYHPALQLRDWVFAGRRIEGGSLTATVVHREPIAAAQRPLSFVFLANGDRQIWPVTDLVEVGERVTLTIGPWGAPATTVVPADGATA